MTAGSRDRRAALAGIRRVLAAACACPEQAFLDDGVTIVVARVVEGRMRFPPPANALTVMTMGAGVVISCHPNRLAWARARLGDRSRDAIFAAPTIAQLARYVERDDQEMRGPEVKYACSADGFRPAAPPGGVAVALVDGAAIAELYQHPGFEHALAYRTDTARPDMAAAVATEAGAIAGVAGASADAEALWQIGVDVIAGHRGRGIGRAVVSRLTEALLERGVIPYYSTAVSNLRSQAVALGLGYWPAWTMLYARSRPSTAAEGRA